MMIVRKSPSRCLIFFISVFWIGLVCGSESRSESPFAIRGTLPWHNFLSGPSAWNLNDYETYLDRMADLGMNFVGFHCYTGGGLRYVNYVEPMIRVQYLNVLPLAEYDTSITARWGYSPLTTDRFAFGTGRFFTRPVFGADCALEATNQEDRYRQAQALMKQVMDYAHRKGMQFCLGFEFGIYPPEFFSIVNDSMLSNPYLPDPTHPASIRLLELYLEDILRAYPDIDVVWFWLQEHNVTEREASLSPSLREFFDKNRHWFSDLEGSDIQFSGLWSLAYIQQAYQILHRLNPKVKMAISGWGGDWQLPMLLPSLHRALPKEIVFSCLNSGQGKSPQRKLMGEFDGRETWVIPWLEGDERLWHPQPRVSLLAEQVAMAAKQEVDGVIGIHWRTEDIWPNFEALAQYMQSPPQVDSIRLMTDEEKKNCTASFYQVYCRREYGETAADEMARWWSRFDLEQLLAPSDGGASSPEYYPYLPYWGDLSPTLRQEIKSFHQVVVRLRQSELNPVFRANLEYVEHTLHFVLLLDEVGDCMKPAREVRDDYYRGVLDRTSVRERWAAAWREMDAAPFQDLFETYSKRIRSRGELGVLSSLNQKLWVYACDMKDFLNRVPGTREENRQ